MTQNRQHSLGPTDSESRLTRFFGTQSRSAKLWADDCFFDELV